MLKIDFNTVFEHFDDFSDEFFWLVFWPLFDAANLREALKILRLAAQKVCDYEFQC